MGRPIGIEIEIAIEIVVYFLCESATYSQGARRNDFDPDFDFEKNSARIDLYGIMATSFLKSLPILITHAGSKNQLLAV